MCWCTFMSGCVWFCHLRGEACHLRGLAFCILQSLNSPYVNPHSSPNSLLARSFPREVALLARDVSSLHDFALFQVTMPVGKYKASPACFLPACGLRSWLFAGFWTGRWTGGWNPAQCRGTEGSPPAGATRQRVDLPGTPGKHPLSGWAPSWKNGLRQASNGHLGLLRFFLHLYSHSAVDTDSPFQGPCAISGLGRSLFRALRKPNVEQQFAIRNKKLFILVLFFHT